MIDCPWCDHRQQDDRNFCRRCKHRLHDLRGVRLQPFRLQFSTNPNIERFWETGDPAGL